MDLKETCSPEDVEMVVSRLNTLADISGVENLYVSQREETNDHRAITDYDLMLYMEFEGLSDLNSYASDSVHLLVRADIGPYVASGPRVLDSTVR